MQGIRIINKNQQSGNHRLIDYEFREVADAITEEISGLFWILSGVTFRYRVGKDEVLAEHQDHYDACIIGERNDLRLTGPDFISDNARFVQGDWDIIIGIRKADDFQRIGSLTYQDIEKYAVVLFTCIDAAFWEIYSPVQAILAKVGAKFPNNEPCLLDKKKWP